jgi:MFS family permease
MKATVTSATSPRDGADPRRWLALCVLLAGTLLPPLDFFIVNVALPAIQTDLQATPSLAQLVVSVYAAAYAVTLILGGRLGDLYGRKRMFIVGMLGFGVASALCGCAPSPGVLVAGRLLQGISAAIMAPQSLASIQAIFPAREKSRALGMYGATFGAASVAGQLLGGLLVSADLFGLGWRTVFLINLPIIALAVPAAISWVRDSRSEQAGPLDIVGALLLAAGLLAVVVPLIEGRERGWPWWSVGLLALGPPLLVAFWRCEQRQERGRGTPLVPPSVLASPGLRRSLAATFFFYTIAPFFLVFAVYERTGLGHDALTAGLAVLPLGIGYLLGPLCSSTVARRMGANTAAFGMGLEVVGMLAAASIAWFDAPAWLPTPLFLIGLGQGLALPALVRLNVDQVDARWAGLAAGLVSATLQISAAVSTAIIGGLFFALLTHVAGPGAVKTAFSVALLAMGAGLGLAAVLSRGVRSSCSARADA